jgi:hypothetical protein
MEIPGPCYNYGILGHLVAHCPTISALIVENSVILHMYVRCSFPGSALHRCADSKLLDRVSFIFLIVVLPSKLKKKPVL